MPTQSIADNEFLALAVELAKEGKGLVSPNPLVGAVVVRKGKVIGRGWHAAYGAPHAERMALDACEEADLSDATLYISLEPCSHHGKTPPCTDAILAAEIKRVVVASDDPSEKASGKGIEILRESGVEVVVVNGEVSAAARELNQPFRKHARSGRPWILAKWAMSLDGKVASKTGDSQWISSESSRQIVHQRRSECDAVAIGIGTALSDNPLLTARVEGARQPKRVIFDSHGRLPLRSKLVQSVTEAPIIVVTSKDAPEQTIDALRALSIEVVFAEGESESERVSSALDELGLKGITSILLEGGPRLAGAFCDAQEIDEIIAFIAPVVIGGSSARSPIEGIGLEKIADASGLRVLQWSESGGDILVRARVKDW